MTRARKGSIAAAASTVEAASVSATDAQNNFGRVLERVSSEGVVYITRHRRRQAVVLSADRYDALMRTGRPDLDALTRDFDEMMGRMQSPGTAAAFDALFSASPEALGRAAVRGARAVTTESVAGEAAGPISRRRGKAAAISGKVEEVAKAPPRASAKTGSRRKSA